jgi:RNA polymerase sigma factor (sigma-70 family)
MEKPDEFLPTQLSLLGRLKNLEDNKSWLVFVDRYRPFVTGVIKKGGGLSESEVDDAVQETFITVAKYIKGFKYDPSRKFKGWLTRIAKTRHADQFRKRLPVADARPEQSDQASRTVTIDKVPDPTRYGFDAKWDDDQREHNRQTALDRIRDKVNPKHYQIFYAHVIQGWTADEVQKTLGVTIAQVHKVKSRIMKQLAKEAERIKKGPA